MTKHRHVGLSKSRYCTGLQCVKQLWWRVHEPDAPELETDPTAQAVFDHGNQVGALARDRFPGGALIDFEPWEFKERVQATRQALSEGAPAIYEASFLENGVFVAVDVLARVRGGFRLVEVKSSTSPKPEHIPDVAIQIHVARAAGIEVRTAEVMHLSRECRFPDLSNLFAMADVTGEAEGLQREIPAQVRKMRAALAGTLPGVEPGAHCNVPYECPFKSRCWPELPPHHVSTIYRVGERAAKLVENGFETIHDLEDDMKLSPTAARQVRSVKTGKLIVEPGLGEALAGLKPPVAYLDFETVSLPVPIWDGCAPYDSVPVQFSCHLVGARGTVAHFQHLAEGRDDPRPALARALVAACGDASTVVGWNASFEKKRIEELAAALPAYRKALRGIADRVVDLLAIVRAHVYHPDFGGSFSMKRVLPALVPKLAYDDLDIGEGGTAQAVLESLLLNEAAYSIADRKKVRRQLLDYCERDTLGLLKIAECLRGVA